MNIDLIQAEAKKPKKSSGRGGFRKGAGRKTKPDEAHLMQQLYPLEGLAVAALRDGLEKRDSKAMEIFFKYYYGLPTQKVESKIEGQLNQVNVEVVRPNTDLLKKVG